MHSDNIVQEPRENGEVSADLRRREGVLQQDTRRIGSYGETGRVQASGKKTPVVFYNGGNVGMDGYRAKVRKHK